VKIVAKIQNALSSQDVMTLQLNEYASVEWHSTDWWFERHCCNRPERLIGNSTKSCK